MNCWDATNQHQTPQFLLIKLGIRSVELVGLKLTRRRQRNTTFIIILYVMELVLVLSAVKPSLSNNVVKLYYLLDGPPTVHESTSIYLPICPPIRQQSYLTDFVNSDLFWTSSSSIQLFDDSHEKLVRFLFTFFILSPCLHSWSCCNLASSQMAQIAWGSKIFTQCHGIKDAEDCGFSQLTTSHATIAFHSNF